MIDPSTPYWWSEVSISFTRAYQWLNFDHLGKYPLLVSLVVDKNRVKNVLIGDGSNINVSFSKTLWALKISRAELRESDNPFLASYRVNGSPHLGNSTYPSPSAHLSTSVLRPSALRWLASTAPKRSSLSGPDWPSSWTSRTIHAWLSKCQGHKASSLSSRSHPDGSFDK